MSKRVSPATSAVSPAAATTADIARTANRDSSSREAAAWKHVQRGQRRILSPLFPLLSQEITPSAKQISFSLLFSHFGNKTTMVCEHCDPSCTQCLGHGNRNCLSCRSGYVYMAHWAQCLQKCPDGYYNDKYSNSCHKCHPTCKTCSGKGSLSCHFVFTTWLLFSKEFKEAVIKELEMFT